MSRCWAEIVQVVNERRKLLSTYNILKVKLASHTKTHEKCCKLIDSIVVSEVIADNIALPVRYVFLLVRLSIYSCCDIQNIVEHNWMMN